MNILVATDIFGTTPAVANWFKPLLQATNFTLEVVSPYPSPLADMSVDRVSSAANAVLAKAGSADQLAYQQFLQQGGLSAYVEKLQSVLHKQQSSYLAVGFSAGAAALWQLAAEPQPGLERIFCFYGGQIRSCVELQPCVATTFIWAQETHFDVGALHHRMQQRERIKSYLTPYPHGFINPASDGFDSAAASFYQQWFIEQVVGCNQSQLSTPFIDVNS
jgi:hypothetical protein